MVEACLADGGVGNCRLMSEFSAWCPPLTIRDAQRIQCPPPATWVLSDKASKLKDEAGQKTEEIRGGPVTE